MSDPDTVYEPVGVTPAYDPPAATIDPDDSKGWARRLWPVVRSHRSVLIAGVVTGFVALIVQVAVPATAAQAIDAVTDDSRSSLWAWVWVLLGLAVARLLFGGVYRYLLFKLAWSAETDLRAIMYEHLTRLSFSFYDRTQSGQVISRANSDIRSIQLLLAFTPLVAMSFITFGLAFALMLTIHVGLTLVAIATLPGVYLLGVRLRNAVFPLSWVTQARMAELATIVDENVNGTRVVKSFAAEERQIADLASVAQRIRWSNVQTMRARARYNPLIEALPRLGMAMVLLYGGWLAINGSVTIGTLFAFNAYVIMLQAPFRMLGFLLLQSQRAAAAATRIYEVLDEVPEIVDAPWAVDLVQPDGRVVFDGVDFAYASRSGSARDDAAPPVLEQFDLTIEPGERVAVVGRTGSGKSTVARLLARFYDVTAGAVCVDGQDVRNLTLRSLRHTVGIVADEPFLFSTTLRDNIAYGRPGATDAEVVDAAKAAQAHDFISALPHGYDTVVGERGYTLSGGQRQRVAIARTLLANPKILVLDDATSAIDVQVEQSIHGALLELMRHRTTIIIAHRLSTIALAERVVLVEGGRITATGTHSELLRTNPRYVEILARADGDLDDSGLDEPKAVAG